MADLIRAIECANANTTSDKIILGSNIVLPTANNETLGSNGLPAITSNITLEGANFTLTRNTGYSCDGSDPSFRLFFVTQTGNLTLNNLTLKNGCALGGVNAAWGGAISMAEGATINLSQVALLDNSASIGGAIFVPFRGSLLANNITAQNNNALNQGGAIHGDYGSTINVANSVLSNNSSTNLGGAVSNFGIGMFTHSTFDNNTTGSYGGGIYNNGLAKITLLNSTVSNNSSGYFGGGLVYDGSGTIDDSTFVNNSSPRGGGVLVYDGTLTIANSTFSGNSAENYGGGIGNRNGDLTLRHVTITGNSSPTGAGVSSKSNADTTLTILDSSIVAGNDTTTDSGEDVQITGDGSTNTFQSNGYNVIGTVGTTAVIDGTDDITGVVDPLLNTLSDNGCETQHATTSGLACVQTHGLEWASLAIDLATGSTEATDQRGSKRPQQGSPDAGAHEAWWLDITAVNANNGELSWQDAISNCTYDVFESTTPYFTHSTSAAYLNASTAHPINGRLGDPTTNYFFINRATCTGDVTIDSNEVGEFDFTIVPGT
ncbi:MAG: choice-of-anchor Q domain-containing protein [Chloroflexota bacterium]